MMVNVYVDMDGVLAKYNENDYVTGYYKTPGYFLTLEQEANAVVGIKTARNHLFDFERSFRARYGIDLRIRFQLLSKVENYSAGAEKEFWAGRHGIYFPATFVPQYASKRDYVKIGVGVTNILVDDFTKNLVDWEAGGDEFIGVKFLNGINDTNKSWSGRRIGGDWKSIAMSLSDIVMETVYKTVVSNSSRA